MSVDRQTPALDRLTAAATELDGTYEVRLTLPANTAPGEATNAAKLRYLAADDRDFLAVTPQLEAAVLALAARAVRELLLHNLPTDVAFRAIGEGVRAHVAERFVRSSPTGPPDVPMRPLSAAWARRKGHRRVGVYTGRLMLALADARVETKKVR